jgi:hypothetical protein
VSIKCEDLNMKKYMTIEMPDKSVWQVPVAVIASNRAEAYKHEFGGDVFRSLNEDTIPLFKDDEYAIEDWAANNMNWRDVAKHAVMVSGGDVDYQEGWVNGEKDFSND